MRSLRTQTYFRLSLLSHDCEPEPGNDFCDVGILSQSQFNSSSPRTTARAIRREEHSSFILSWNLIGQRETKVITSQKSFPGSGSRTLFSAETSDSRKYVCVRRLVSHYQSHYNDKDTITTIKQRRRPVKSFLYNFTCFYYFQIYRGQFTRISVRGRLAKIHQHGEVFGNIPS